MVFGCLGIVCDEKVTEVQVPLDQLSLQQLMDLAQLLVILITCVLNFFVFYNFTSFH